MKNLENMPVPTRYRSIASEEVVSNISPTIHDKGKKKLIIYSHGFQASSAEYQKTKQYEYFKEQGFDVKCVSFDPKKVQKKKLEKFFDKLRSGLHDLKNNLDCAGSKESGGDSFKEQTWAEKIIIYCSDKLNSIPLQTNDFLARCVLEDLKEAIDEEGYLPENIYLYGESMGAYASLAAAAQYHCSNSVQKLAGVILVSPVMSASDALWKQNFDKLSILAFWLNLYDITNISSEKKITTPAYLFQTESDSLVQGCQNKISDAIASTCVTLKTKTYEKKSEIAQNDKDLQDYKDKINCRNITRQCYQDPIDSTNTISKEQKDIRIGELTSLHEHKKKSIDSMFEHLEGHCYVNQDDIENIVNGIEEELQQNTPLPNLVRIYRLELSAERQARRLAELKLAGEKYARSCVEQKLQELHRNPAMQGVVQDTPAPATDEHKTVWCNLFGIEKLICWTSKTSKTSTNTVPNNKDGSDRRMSL